MKNSKKFTLGTSAMRNYALSFFFLMVSVSPALCQEGLPAMTTSTNGTAGSTGTAPPPPPPPTNPDGSPVFSPDGFKYDRREGNNLGGSGMKARKPPAHHTASRTVSVHPTVSINPTVSAPHPTASMHGK